MTSTVVSSCSSEYFVHKSQKILNCTFQRFFYLILLFVALNYEHEPPYVHESVFPSHFASTMLSPTWCTRLLRKQTVTRHQHHHHRQQHRHRHPNKLFVGNCVLLLKIESLYVVIHQFNVSCRRLWVSILGVQLLVIRSVCLWDLVCVFEICIAIVWVPSHLSLTRVLCWDKTVLSRQMKPKIESDSHLHAYKIPSNQPSNQSFNSFQISDRIQIPFWHHFLPWVSE